MTRVPYLLGGVAALALVMLAQSVELVRPRHATSIEAPAAVPAAVSSPDPAATAIDDLAAWPVAAGR